MESEHSQAMIVRFSTYDMPPSDRSPFWREVFARQICHVEIEPESDPIVAEATMLASPSLGVGWCESATPACWKRTSELVKDGNDDLAILIAIGGRMTRTQLGRDLEVACGDAVGVLHAEPASIRFRTLRHIALMVPRATLAPVVADLEDASTRVIPNQRASLRLLTAYLGVLQGHLNMATNPALWTLTATHICDLVALAIGATRDGAEVARSRGVRAARLAALKADLEVNPASTLADLASRQEVTTRYVQILFEEDGTTFSAYSLDARLRRAYQLLLSTRCSNWTISAIAMEAGFGDLSHFNRNFRRRYGASPSEIRAEAARGPLRPAAPAEDR